MSQPWMLTWLYLYSHTELAFHTSLCQSCRADGWRALSVTCWQLDGTMCGQAAPRGGCVCPWLSWWVERGHFPASSQMCPPAVTGMPALPPVLVPAWWHGVISQLTAAGTQSCLPACPQQQRLLTGSCAPSPRGAGLRKGVRAEDGEWCSAGAGRSWRWAERVVETEKKNGILQQGGSGVVDLPHHSSQWPTHLFWHKYSLWSCVEAWRRVPLHLWSSGFVAALLKSELHVLMFCLETQAFRFVILPFQPFPWFTLQSKHSFVPCPRLPFPCLCCWLNFEIWYSSQRCLLGTKKNPNS